MQQSWGATDLASFLLDSDLHQNPFPRLPPLGPQAQCVILAPLATQLPSRLRTPAPGTHPVSYLPFSFLPSPSSPSLFNVNLITAAISCPQQYSTLFFLWCLPQKIWGGISKSDCRHGSPGGFLKLMAFEPSLDGQVKMKEGVSSRDMAEVEA